MEKKAQLNPFVKLALDFGPLILFFIMNGRAGIFWATGVFMAAFVVSVIVSYVLITPLPGDDVGHRRGGAGIWRVDDLAA